MWDRFEELERGDELVVDEQRECAEYERGGVRRESVQPASADRQTSIGEQGSVRKQLFQHSLLTGASPTGIYVHRPDHSLQSLAQSSGRLPSRPSLHLHFQQSRRPFLNSTNQGFTHSIIRTPSRLA